MNWLLVIAVIGILLIGGCVLAISQASHSAQKTITHDIRVTCYDSGWYDAGAGTRGKPPADGADCASAYSSGYSDGASRNYNPPN